MARSGPARRARSPSTETPLGGLQWSCRPWRLLVLEWSCAVALKPQGGEVAGDLSGDFGQEIVGEDIRGRLPISAFEGIATPRGWTGDLELDVTEIRLVGRRPTAASGTLFLRALRAPGAGGQALGDFELVVGEGTVGERVAERPAARPRRPAARSRLDRARPERPLPADGRRGAGPGCGARDLRHAELPRAAGPPGPASLHHRGNALESAPGVEQREVEADLQLAVRLQQPHRIRITLELAAVALELVVEESRPDRRLRGRSSSSPRPSARPLSSTKVRSMRRPCATPSIIAVSASSERPSRAFGSSRRAACLLPAMTGHRAPGSLERRLEVRAVDAERGELAAPARLGPRVAGAGHGCLRHALQLGVHDLADGLRDRAGPVEFRPDRRLALAANPQHRRTGRLRRLGRPEVGRNAARRRRGKSTPAVRCAPVATGGRAASACSKSADTAGHRNPSRLAAGGRFSVASVIRPLHPHVADQVQPAARPRGRDVGEAPELELLPRSCAARASSARAHRRAFAFGGVGATGEHDAALAGTGRDRRPVEQRPVGAPRAALQVRQDRRRRTRVPWRDGWSSPARAPRRCRPAMP